jgi:fumarate hydratase subunit alpha
MEHTLDSKMFRMKTVTSETIIQSVKDACIRAAHELPQDVLDALSLAIDRETNPDAKHILELLLENASFAKKEMIPLCQDTGVTVIFVEQGGEVLIEGNLADIINEAVRLGYEEGYLRKSIVIDPLYPRKNTETNTPVVIHHSWTSGQSLKLSIMLKGAGCENKSQIKMLPPSAGENGVKEFILNVVKSAGADACPPFIVGVGIGGNFELAPLLAKKALLRPLNQHHPNPNWEKMEHDCLIAMNQLNIGPQGMGGDTTALAVLIETYPCHIASLPVAVCIECHSHRHTHVTI